MRLNINLTEGKIKRNVFFTSDFHCFHKNVIRFDDRPFSSVDEMHIAIENGWNEVVGPDDIVVYLGDLSFAKREEKEAVNAFVSRLNGSIHFVLGNHDKYDEIIKNTTFKSVSDYLEVRITHLVDNVSVKTLFCCMHYPIYSWNKSHHGSIMVHGHCHMNLSDTEFHKTHRIIDVGCMDWNYKPLSFLEVLNEVNSKNLIDVIHHNR